MEFLPLSRRRSSARNVPSDEERGETDVFAGYGRVLARVLARILAYGVTNRAYNWCHSYLSGGRQLVCIDGKESSLECVNRGVPQGSTLGPLFLHLIYQGFATFFVLLLSGPKASLLRA